MSSRATKDKTLGKFLILRQCVFWDYKCLVNAYSQFSDKKYDGQWSPKCNEPESYGFNKPLNKFVAISCCLSPFTFGSFNFSLVLIL